jgi:hypothetical protein
MITTRLPEAPTYTHRVILLRSVESLGVTAAELDAGADHDRPLSAE